MKVGKFLFLVGYVAMLTTIVCVQQDENKERTATIYGQVLAPDDKPIEGLRVSIWSNDLRYAESTCTDKQGRYKFEKVKITQDRKYQIRITDDIDPRDPLMKGKQILSPDKYAIQDEGVYCILQNITLEDKEHRKEVNFKLTKPAVITCKVTFEDGTPVKDLWIGPANTYYGTRGITDENGIYTIKGVKPDENGKVAILYSLRTQFEIKTVNIKPEQESALVNGEYIHVILYDIHVREGETVAKNITIPKSIDASKIPIRYQVFVNGQLCTFEKIMKLSPEMIIGAEGLHIEIKNEQKGYIYSYSPPIHGKAEIWDIPQGKYKLEVKYHDFAKVFAYTEIEIKENKTLELEFYITVKDKKLEKIEIKLKE